MILVSIQNYHRHSHYSNIIIADSVTTNEEYAQRAKELDSKILVSTEHGYQGNYYETYEIANKNKLKFIFGVEAYWVLDRKSTDSSNCHICLLAKSEKGRRAINKALATANRDGYYYRPRLDLELIMNLSVDDVFLTSACIAYWKYENIDDITLQFFNKFKNNFNLEIQNHPSQRQIDLNKHIKELSNRYNISLIAGLDSHYIYENEKQKRLDYLEGRGIIYKDTDEADWYMDYPDDETIVKRFQQQNVFTDQEIYDAIKRTDEFLTFDNITFDSSTKMVSLYPTWTQEQKNNLYKSIINNEFKKYAKKNNLSKEEIQSVYKDGIQLEANTVIDTNIADYFLFDYELVKKGIKKGGVITPTGRGSGVSYFTNTLLGFSKVDRFKAPIHLYPERFISKSRILESKQMPDLDLNLGNVEPFAEAQRELIGENHAYPMIAYGKMKVLKAFKMYCRAYNVDFDTANKIGNQIRKYELAVKYEDDEDEKELIDIYEYVDEKYKTYIENSRQYQKIVDTKSSHPCAWLIYQGEIDEEIGLIRCKSETTGKDTLVAAIDGATADKYGFLKNDLLKVDVVMLNYTIFKRINMEVPSLLRLLELIKNDGGKTWNIYAKGATSCINQVAKKSTTLKVQKYLPKSDGELACFVAAIRPSFKSLYKQYENREHFEYGIPSLDKILQTEQIPESFIFFQEQIMRVMNYAGIPMDRTYEIIKAISKKKPEKVLKYKEIFLKGFADILIKDENKSTEEAKELSATIWKIVEDFCFYGFNSSHAYCVAGDSLYGAYLKANYTLEFYEASLNYYTEKKKKEKISELCNEATNIFGIKFNSFRYGLDNTKFIIDNGAINRNMATVKYLNKGVAKDLYSCSKKNKYSSFYELLCSIQNLLNSRQLEILIKLDYFQEFGNAAKLLKFVELFDFFKDRKQFSKSEEYPVKIETIKQFCSKETEKTYSEFDSDSFLKYVWEKLPNKDLSLKEKIQAQYEYMGYIDSSYAEAEANLWFVLEISNKYKNYMLTVYNIRTGEQETIKLKKKYYDGIPIQQGDVIKIFEIAEDFKWYKDEDGKWQQKDEKEKLLTNYKVIN